MESNFDITTTSATPQTEDNIDEVYDRLYMSGYMAAESWKTIERLGITHILSVTPGARAKFANKGIKYLLFTEVKDNDE